MTFLKLLSTTVLAGVDVRLGNCHSGQSMGCAACFKQMGWKFGQVFLEKIWKLTQNQTAPPHVQINPKVFNLPLPRTESRQGARH